MFIRRLKLKNFQCHAKLELEFGPGLNAIVGESDKGKTAILRAIRWALFNQPDGQAFRRHGTPDMFVEVELEDGTIVRRVRSARVNRYVLERPGEEDQVFDNFGRDVPPEIIRATGVRPATFRREGLTIEMSYGGQFASPFLLTDSGLVRAQVLGYISRTSVLDEAARKLNDGIRQLGRDIVVGEQERDRLRDELARYGDLEAEAARLTELEGATEAAVELDRRIVDVVVIGRSIADADGVIGRGREKLERYAKIPTIDRLDLIGERADAGERILRSLEAVEGELASMRTELANTGTIDAAEVAGLEALADQVVAAESMHGRAMTWKRGFETDLESQERIELEFGAARREYVEALKAGGVCPVCFQDVDDDAASHLEEVLAGGET